MNIQKTPTSVDELLSMSLRELLTLEESCRRETSYSVKTTTKRNNDSQQIRRRPFADITKQNYNRNSNKETKLQKRCDENYLQETVCSKVRVLKRRAARSAASPISRSRNLLSRKGQQSTSLLRSVVKTQHGRRCISLL